MKKILPPKANITLKQQRLQRCLTQSQLAEKLGTTIMNVSRWERGIISPGLHFQQQLCNLFQLSPAELGLQESENIPSELPRPGIIDPALPLTFTGTIGRQTLLNQLVQQVLAGNTNIALTGLPGVGKTTLATMLAFDPAIQSQFPDGTLWVSLGRQPQIITRLSHWGTVLEITPQEMSGLTTIDAWGCALRDRIGSRRMLLILDDAWNTEDIVPFYLNGHHCMHIVTTRFPTIAHTFTLNNVYTVPAFERAESLALLQQLIPDVCETFPNEVATLIQQVGDLPLALTLIGRHLLVHAHTGPRRRVYQHLLRLIEYVDERLSIQYPLAWEHTPSGSYHSLRATIATSYNILSSQAQTALRALAIFPYRPQGFSEKAALSTCHIETAMLDELVDNGLLTYTLPDRYHLHPTIRDMLHLLPLDLNREKYGNHVLSSQNPLAQKAL